MKKCAFSLFLICAFLLSALSGCIGQKEPVKLGVSFGAGPAVRWVMEQGYMEEYANELEIEMDVRFNTVDSTTTQDEDCISLIDSGIDVLILMPRDATECEDILAYAAKKNVPVVVYARVIHDESVSIFVGYDCGQIGQSMGQYLAETVDKGDYIILQGSSTDTNAALLYEGAMRDLDPIRNDINVLLDDTVAGWDPEIAKQMVKDAVSANGGHVDAILAPNDKIAGASAEALAELGVTEHVVITGMDAELDAVKRIAANSQDITFHMDLRDMARVAVDEAVHLAKGEKLGVNAEFPNGEQQPIPSHLIAGQMITSKNIDKILIDGGYFTHEEIYGS